MPLGCSITPRGQAHHRAPTPASLWIRGAASPGASLESRQVHQCQEDRSRLLAMSVTTAERCLRRVGKPAPGLPAITQAGPLLKDQIPIRIFQQWNESQPGFVEADLVGHHGEQTQGSFLYTLTLTDIATGW